MQNLYQWILIETKHKDKGDIDTKDKDKANSDTNSKNKQMPISLCDLFESDGEAEFEGFRQD